jgi:hypothetical protein
LLFRHLAVSRKQVPRQPAPYESIAGPKISNCGSRNPPPAGKPKLVPAASFSFLFLLIVLFRGIFEHLTKEKDKEARERSET